MSEPLEYYGVWAASLITGVHNNALERRLGERDATCRRGAKDAPLWLCERVLDYAATGKLRSAPDNSPTFYTVTEGARFVGIGLKILQKILPKEAPAILAPSQSSRSEPEPLYPLSWLHAIRQAIATGRIPVQPQSLTKPKMGARVCQPRHVWANQSRESEELRRVAPFDFVIW
jgi:hypothetical protein